MDADHLIGLCIRFIKKDKHLDNRLFFLTHRMETRDRSICQLLKMLQGSYLCFLMRNTFNYTKLLFSIIRGIEK